MSESKKIYIDWKDIEEYLNAVIEDVNKRGLKPSGVYGLPRGGLIYATWLSYKMNIPLLMNPAENCIIIDDISDTGRSLYHFTDNRSQFNKYYITTMFYCKDTLVMPDFCLKEKKIGDWIVYPYEE